jgi:hypothetical protein
MHVLITTLVLCSTAALAAGSAAKGAATSKARVIVTERGTEHKLHGHREALMSRSRNPKEER